MRYWVWLLWIVSCSGCVYLTPAKEPMGTTWLERAAGNEKLLLLMPGLGDDLDSFIDNRVAQRFVAACSGYDVLYVDAYLAYYRNHSLPVRLENDVFSQISDYKKKVILGVSMGGFGAVLSARDFNDQVDGLVLVAPFLGDEEVLKRIAAAGGVRRWQMQDSSEQYERLWSWIKANANSPLLSEHTFLLTGDQDAMYESHQLLRPLLRNGYFRVVHGGHKWKVWNRALDQWLANGCPLD